MKMNINRQSKSITEFTNEGKKEAIKNSFRRTGTAFKQENKVFENIMGF